ncbi:hypothetical protein TcasGA2_TC032096 [Tribolium castaneum]|uniref:Uncharacterized protein n=1 Tax=Tribolium castaneum TaxID=7070 RepID=A0A139WMN5_TRICA|nr:hypothetical protein TcasGA2_TC032096 [Tribolium castaneum]
MGTYTLEMGFTRKRQGVSKRNIIISECLFLRNLKKRKDKKIWH